MSKESTVSENQFESIVTLPERTKFIRESINSIVDLIDPSEDLKRDGFCLTQVFNDVDEIEAGSFNVNYSGDENTQLLHLTRFYGKPLPDGSAFVEGTGKDKAFVVEMQWWKKQEGPEDSIHFSEWDENIPKLRGEHPNTRKAKSKIDSALHQFKRVWASDPSPIKELA